jgi:hypothetical protein
MPRNPDIASLTPGYSDAYHVSDPVIRLQAAGKSVFFTSTTPKVLISSCLVRLSSQVNYKGMASAGHCFLNAISAIATKVLADAFCRRPEAGQSGETSGAITGLQIAF